MKKLLLAIPLATSLTGPLWADTVVVFNEIMYHPATNEPAREWVEFRNLLAVDVDISGWVIRGAIHYDFPSNSIVNGGSFLLVAPSNSPLGAITGLTNIYGPFAGRLGNNGDHLELRNNSGWVMDEVTYGVEDDWPVAADGSGVSLAKIDPDSTSGPGANWASSAQVGGTPGAENFPRTDVFVPPLGLVSYWKFDESGTQTADQAGQNIGTLGSGVSRVNGAVSFNGTTNAFVNFGPGTAQSSFAASVGVTIEMAVKPNWDGSTTAVLFAKAPKRPGSYRDTVLASGPLAYWRLDEATGTSVRDTTANGRNGTATTGVVLNQQSLIPTDPTNTAVRVKNSDRVKVNGFEKIGPRGYTVEFWVRPYQLPTACCQGLVGDGESSGDYFMMNYILGPNQGLVGAVRPHFGPANSPVSMDSPTALQVGQTYHIVTTWDATSSANNAVIYINGAANRIGTTTQNLPAAGTTGANPVYIGKDDRDTDTSSGDSTIDEVALYNYPFTAADVATHYFAATAVNFDLNLGNAMQLAFQNDGKNAEANPPVPPGPVLSFGLVVNGVYSELDMPLDGQEGRPTLAALQDGSIHHLAATYNSATGVKAIFVDGVLRFSTTLSGLINADNGADAVAGNSATLGTSPYTGALDNLAFWGKALSASDLAAHADAVQAGNDYFTPTSQVVTLHLAFNELSSSTNGEFWVELMNTGTNPVPLDGFTLYYDGPTNAAYVFPAGPTLAPGEFLTLNNATLGFFPTSGEKLYLYGPNRTNVFDSVVVKKRARGRWPDGTGEWLNPSTPTPEASNSFVFHDEIVINEVMYHHARLPSPNGLAPQESGEQWIELYNRSTNTVNLTGWEIDGGVKYQFPTNKTIGPGAYLVVAENITDLRSRYPSIDMVGDFNGQLSGKGNRIVLVDPAGNPANTIRYYDSAPWPEYADGGSSSLELRDPNADNSKAEAWAASDETHKTSWQSYSYRMVANVPSGSGQPTQWNDFIFGLLGEGECLIDDIAVVESPTNSPVQLIANGNFENGLTGWRVLGNHVLSQVELDPENAGNHVLHVIASGAQEHMHNHIEITHVNQRAVVNGREYQISFRARWLAGNNFLNTRLYFNRVARTTALPMPTLNGTPGAPNSCLTANIGPTFSQFQHQPVMPQPGVPVTVSVLPSDPQGVSACAVWWSVNSGAWANAPMTKQADGLYTGTIPGQVAGAIVQFYARAVDGLGAAATYPAAGPDSGALYMVTDGQANLSLGHNIRIVLTPANRALLHALTNVMSNDELPGTVIYDESRAYYDVAVRLKGSERGRYSDTRVSFHLRFPSDDLFRGFHPVMLIDRSGAGDSTANKQQEIVIRHILLHAGNIPGTYPDLCRVIAPFSTHTGPAIFSPRHEDRFIETVYQNGGNGTQWELELIYYPTSTNVYGYKNPQPDSVVGTDLTNLGDDKEIYRYNFIIKNHRDADDYAPFMRFAKSLSLSGNALDQATREVMDVDEWMRAWAHVTLCAVGDSYTFGNNHNLFMYLRPSDGKMLAFPVDMDFSFNRGTTAALVGDQNLSKVINLTPNLRIFYAHILDIINSTYNASYITWWANRYDDFCPGQSYAGVPSYVQQRGDYAKSVISGAGGNAAFAITSPTNITISSNLVTLAGTAPVTVRTIKVNGQEYPITWTSLSAWTLRLTVSSPTNELAITCYDINGSPLTNYNRTVTVNYTGTPLEPEGNVVFSEIMYRPATNGAAYIELQNRAATHAFDLSGWRIGELNYEFPSGTLLGPRSILVLAQDPTAFAAAYTTAPTVFGTYSTPLDPNGQTLSLVKPSANPAEVVVVDRVRYESGTPWPAAANDQGAALQLIDGAVDNARVSDWSDGLGWRFVSITGTVATTATNFLIFLQQVSDVYIDDILLVPGTQAGVGESLVQNGDFEGLEGPLTAPWGYTMGTSNIVTTNVTYVTNGSVIITNTIKVTNYVQYLAATNLTNSVISGERVHSGNASLHMVSTGVGTVTRSIAQAITSPPTNTSYTLSFWYYSSPSNATLVARTLGGSGMSTNLSIRAVTFTPGTANSTTAPLPPYPLVWLNEAQPRNVNGPTDNAGEREPWIELYNSGPDAVSLEDCYLASSYTNLTEWRFPAGAVIQAGQFLVVWADGEPGETTTGNWHASFTLDGASGSVALVRLIDGKPQIMDYLNYADVAPDQSYGDYPDAQPFERRVFDRATPGASNLVPPVTVVINEWMANNSPGLGGYPDPIDGHYDDWIELFNPGENPMDISGLYLTDNLANRTQWRIPDGTVIPGHGFRLIWADDDLEQNGQGTNGDLHASFKLERNGEAIGLFALVGTNLIQIDAVTFGPQFNNASEGRYPDAAAARQFMATPTPRAPNLPGNTVPTLPLIPDQIANVGQDWTYVIAATDPDVPPQTLDFSLIGMPPLGVALDPLSGLLTWSPTPDQIGTNLITVQVTDNGTPGLSALRSFNVVVIEALLLEHITRLPTGEMSFTVGVTVGKTYRTEYKDDLGAPEWTPLGPDQVAVTNQLTLTFTPDASPQRFYRVVQVD
jgi:hypothetical protein